VRHPPTAEETLLRLSFVPFLPLRREIRCKKKPSNQDMDATHLETLERVWEAGNGRLLLN